MISLDEDDYSSVVELQVHYQWYADIDSGCTFFLRKRNFVRQLPAAASTTSCLTGSTDNHNKGYENRLKQKLPRNGGLVDGDGETKTGAAGRARRRHNQSNNQPISVEFQYICTNKRTSKIWRGYRYLAIV